MPRRVQEVRTDREVYFGLLEDLKYLFKRDVDLVMASAVKNPSFSRRGSSPTMISGEPQGGEIRLDRQASRVA
jgi:hypothetical protein